MKRTPILLLLVCTFLVTAAPLCGGGVGTDCDRPAGRTDTTYGYMGQEGQDGCGSGYACFAEVGETRGKCSLSASKCAPGLPPYQDGYYNGPSPNCPVNMTCEMRGAPPVQRAYFGICVNAPVASAPVTLTCGSPVPDSFAHVAGRSVDYVIDGCDLTITKAVTFGPGVVIALNEGRSIRVGDTGSLRAVGTAQEHVVLKRGGANAWGAVVIFNSASANELAFVELRGGGSAIPEGSASVIVGASAFAGGEVSIRDCVFDAFVGAGISVGKGGKLRAFERNTFTGPTPTRVAITPEALGALAGPGNTFGDGLVDVRSDGGPTAATVTWGKLPVPYRIKGTVELLGAHTIAAGVTLLMAADANLAVRISQTPSEGGKLSAVGTATNLIQIRGESSAPGSWGGIFIQTAGPNTLSFVKLVGGGGKAAEGATKGMVALDPNVTGSAVSIRDCVFEASAGWGIVAAGQSVNSDVATANQFTDNALGNVSP